MSKVYTDNIEKRTGGTEMAVPATGKWPQGNIADNAIGASQMADDAVGVAELSATGTASATTFLRGDNSWTTVADNTTQWQAVQTAAFAAVAGNGYPVNTTSAAITVTLPAGSVGDVVEIIDYAGTADTNYITIAANGSEKIQGLTANQIMQSEREGVRLVYVDATQGWIVGTTGYVGTVVFAPFSGSGGAESTSGAYTIHTYTTSSTFTVTGGGSGKSIDY